MENTLHIGQKMPFSARGEIPLVLCDEICHTDLTDDFTLPDYMPEIVRLLRVGVKTAPADSYLTGGAVKAACSLGYDVLYVGGDGNVYSTVLPASCEFSVLIAPDCVWEHTKGADIRADISPESVISRVSGARKLNVKCRVSAKIRAIGKRTIADDGSISDDGHVQRLFSMSEYSIESFGSNNDVKIVDDIGTLRDDERYLCSDCRVFVEQATAYDGYAECRGTIVMKHLLSGAGGELRSISDKMNFSEVIEADGMRSGDSVMAFGHCYEATLNGEGDSDGFVNDQRTVNALVSLYVRGFRTEAMGYLKDAYSTLSECFLQRETYKLPLYRGAYNRNMTFSGTESLEKLPALSDGARIVDVFAESYDGNVELSDAGRCVISGKCRFNLISVKDGLEGEGKASPEYSAVEVELPFKYDCAEGCEGFEMGNVVLENIGARARIDGDRLELGCEIAIACDLLSGAEVNAICSLTVGGASEKNRRGFTVCYPDKNDSLWSISKKYRARVDHTAEENGIELTLDADSKKTLEGIKYMIV